MNPKVIIETKNITSKHLTDWTPREFTWGPIRKDDCTMAEGAKWTLLPNGTATFEATVTSTTDDSEWTIWHVDLLSRNGTLLGSLATEHPINGDVRKFAQSMPNRTEACRFRAWATFNPNLWPDIETLKMYSSC